MNKNNFLFHIKSLSCSYRKGKEILRIRDISIPREQLVILLGRSGSGKSTFLETLGLMNNTISDGEVLYNPGNGLNDIYYSMLWNKHKLKDIARIRNDYFSFIFQSTNLMPNFTAHENAYLTELLHGVSRKKASQKIAGLLNELGLGDITSSRKTSEMSGGQKQRIAFIRAVASNFSVIFGDEPTGNLDDFNSRELLIFLRDHIKKNSSSAIIVSHNIAMSLQFGDVIMLLSQVNGQNSCYELISDHVFHKNEQSQSWANHEDHSLSSDELYIKIQTILGGNSG